jgi:hypothetical protein
MATVILSHRVNDFNTWKPFYEADKPRRDAAGLTEIAVGRKSDDPGLVYMIWDAKDTSSLQKMISDPELAKVMKEAGVISAPELVIVE